MISRNTDDRIMIAGKKVKQEVIVHYTGGIGRIRICSPHTHVVCCRLRITDCHDDTWMDRLLVVARCGQREYKGSFIPLTFPLMWVIISLAWCAWLCATPNKERQALLIDQDDHRCFGENLMLQYVCWSTFCPYKNDMRW